jgi:hypothetical protein
VRLLHACYDHITRTDLNVRVGQHAHVAVQHTARSRATFAVTVPGTFPSLDGLVVTVRLTGTFNGSEIEPGEVNVPSLPAHVTA